MKQKKSKAAAAKSTESTEVKPVEKNKFAGFHMDPNVLVIVGLDDENTDETNMLVDKDRTRDPVNEGMVLSVYADGVYLPVIVRMNGKTMEVVDGRQRVRAAREANRRRIEKGLKPIFVPVIFRDFEDREAFRAMISTNEHRMDDTPLQRARKAVRLLSYGYTREQTAETFDVSVVAVSSWEKIADLEHKVIDAVEKEKIPFSLAMELAKFPRGEQVAEMEKAIESGVSANALREEMQRRRRQTNAATETDSEERMPKPGTKVLRRLVKARENGEVEFDDTAFKTIRWALGMLPPRNIKGLVDALKQVGAEEQ